MPRLLRWTLAWLLAVALPLQGASAATMLACEGASHGHAMAVAARPASAALPQGQVSAHVRTASWPSLRHAAAPHGLPMAETHRHPQPLPGMGLDRHRHGSDSEPTSIASHKCSACASCCVGVGVPPAHVPMASMLVQRVLPPFLAPSRTAFVGDGPERPPKPFGA